MGTRARGFSSQALYEKGQAWAERKQSKIDRVAKKVEQERQVKTCRVKLLRLLLYVQMIKHTEISQCVVGLFGSGYCRKDVQEDEEAC